MEQTPTAHFFQKNPHKTSPEVQCNVLGKQDNFVALLEGFLGERKSSEKAQFYNVQKTQLILFCESL